MSQISDDCFAFGGPLMTADEATARIAANVPALTPVQTLELAAVDDHVLAADAIALSASPPADNAAVDGYAFRFADLGADGSALLPVEGQAAAGHPLDRPVTPGSAVRIFTGAVMPEGADTVVMQEDVSLDSTRVRIPAGLKAGANRRRAGEDIAAGDLLLAAGERLGPAQVALLSAGGLTRVRVHARPRVTIFSTGDEIRRQGGVAVPGQVHDANGPMLRGLLRRIGIEAVDGGVLPDDAAAVRTALATAAGHSDLILTSGGVSTGDADHVRDVVSELGAVHLWRLEGARPKPLRRWPVVSGFAMTSKPDRREWLRGTLAVGEGGELIASRYPKQGSGVIRSLTDSDGLIEIAEEVTAVAPGDRLGFISFREALS